MLYGEYLTCIGVLNWYSQHIYVKCTIFVAYLQNYLSFYCFENIKTLLSFDIL